MSTTKEQVQSALVYTASAVVLAGAIIVPFLVPSKNSLNNAIEEARVSRGELRASLIELSTRQERILVQLEHIAFKLDRREDDQ